eukprot:1157248-Pelagomonas_calceolata.AAC.1
MVRAGGAAANPADAWLDTIMLAFPHLLPLNPARCRPAAAPAACVKVSGGCPPISLATPPSMLPPSPCSPCVTVLKYSSAASCALLQQRPRTPSPLLHLMLLSMLPLRLLIPTPPFVCAGEGTREGVGMGDDKVKEVGFRGAMRRRSILLPMVWPAMAVAMLNRMAYLGMITAWAVY